MKKLIATFLVTCIFTVFTSCSSNSPRAKEARENAIDCAHNVISKASAGRYALEEALLEAKAVESGFVIDGDTIAARIFNQTFREYITEHNDSLSHEIF